MVDVIGRLRSWLGGDGPPLEAVQGRFLALDLETTGLDPRSDTVVSLAAIPFVDRVPGRGYVTLVHPARTIPPQSTAVHGITDAMVSGAPSLDDVLRDIDAVVGDAVLVGHRVGFDVSVLSRARRARRLPRLRNHALDTSLIAAALHPEWGDFSLERIAERLGVEVLNRHTAEGDALTAGRIFIALLPALQARRLRTVSEVLWFQRHRLAH